MHEGKRAAGIRALNAPSQRLYFQNMQGNSYTLNSSSDNYSPMPDHSIASIQDRPLISQDYTQRTHFVPRSQTGSFGMRAQQDPDDRETVASKPLLLADDLTCVINLCSGVSCVRAACRPKRRVTGVGRLPIYNGVTD